MSRALRLRPGRIQARGAVLRDLLARAGEQEKTISIRQQSEARGEAGELAGKRPQLPVLHVCAPDLDRASRAPHLRKGPRVEAPVRLDRDELDAARGIQIVTVEVGRVT